MPPIPIAISSLIVSRPQVRNVSIANESLEYIEARFNATKFEDPHYVKLRESAGTQVIGVWDDHDYG